MWSAGLPRGAAFDCGEASRALMSWMGKISSRASPKSALVAGCGRAYDAIELARSCEMLKYIEVRAAAPASRHRPIETTSQDDQ